jgi:hypothetical protein
MKPNHAHQYSGATYITRNNWEKNGREREAVGFKRLSGADLVAVKPRPLVNRPYLKPLFSRRRRTKCEKVLVHVKRFMCSVFPNVKGLQRPQKRAESKRGKIQGFSGKSRNRLIRNFLSLEEMPDAFSTLTYDDSILKPLGMDGMVEKVHGDIHRLRAFVRKRFPDVWSKWRVEWKPRKMGECAGMYAPHIHGLWRIGKRNFEVVRSVLLIEGGGDVHNIISFRHRSAFATLTSSGLPPSLLNYGVTRRRDKPAFPPPCYSLFHTTLRLLWLQIQSSFSVVPAPS